MQSPESLGDRFHPCTILNTLMKILVSTLYPVSKELVSPSNTLSFSKSLYKLPAHTMILVHILSGLTLISEVWLRFGLRCRLPKSRPMIRKV
jgi:hypothetical protein